MDKRTSGLFLMLFLVLAFGCLFVPGFFDYIVQSVRCLDSTIQCVRVVP